MSADKCIVEARARIIWGEPSSSVREFLISNGISDLVADAKLKEFELERSRELRKIGRRNVLIGSLLTGAAGILLYLVWADIHLPVEGYGILMVAASYGMWKLVTGISYLVRPQCEHESICDMSSAVTMKRQAGPAKSLWRK
jgi:hypothetical protein